jgi:hypothetical protein
MFRVEKFVSVFALSFGLLGVVSMPAHAFSIIAPAEQSQAADTAKRHYPLAAFAGDAASNAGQDNFLLSAEEVQHVKWCAQRYMSYHAVDNTYQAKSGERVECQSPY